MAAPSRPIFGIDIRPEGIWIAEIRGSWPDAQIVNVAHSAVPASAYDGDKLVDKKAVGLLLKEMVDALPTNTGDAIISIQESSIDVRVMEVPQVPDSELHMVIEGELAHYQIFANQATAVDFMRLTPGEDSQRDTPQVLVVAAEKGAIEACSQIAETAELNLFAVDPVLSGQYRAGILALTHQTEDALIVSIGKTHAEISIISRGNIRLYRRASFGSKQLLLVKEESGFPASLGSWIHQQNAPTIGGQEGPAFNLPDLIDRENVASLAMEIRRSLEYYFNQSPNAPPIVQGILSIQNHNLIPLRDALAVSLNIRMDLAEIPPSWILEDSIAVRLELPEGLAYLGACGVAMRHLTGVPASIPAFNLTPRSRDDGRLQDVRKRLVLSLAASIAALLLGITVSFSLGLKANMIGNELKSSQDQLVGLQRIKQTRLESILKQTALHQTLKTQGYPLPRIIDAINKSMAPDSSLIEVTVNGDGRVVLSGEAGTEKSIIETLQSLKSNAFLEETVLDSFGTMADGGKGAVLERFQVTSRLVGSKKATPKPAS